MSLMGWIDSKGGKQYRVLYVTPDGREYWVTMTSMGPFNDPPPFVATERSDGLIETVDSVYSSLHDLATMHGCILGELVGVEPTN